MHAKLMSAAGALMIGAAFGPALPAAADEAANAAAWDQHVQSVIAHDIDAIMAHFTDDAVLVTRDKVYRGQDEIRTFYEAFVVPINEELLATFGVDNQTAAGDMIVFQYHVTVDGNLVGTTDTIVFEDGKIAFLSNIAYRAAPPCDLDGCAGARQ